MPSSRAPSQPKDRTQVSHPAGRLFTIWATIRHGRKEKRWWEEKRYQSKRKKIKYKHYCPESDFNWKYPYKLKVCLLQKMYNIFVQWKSWETIANSTAVNTPSAQTIVSKYHFPWEGAMAAWRNGDSRAGPSLYLKMHSFFCVTVNQNLLMTPESEKLAKISTVCTKDRIPGKRAILFLMAEAVSQRA